MEIMTDVRPMSAADPSPVPPLSVRPLSPEIDRLARLQAVTAALSESLTPGQVAEVVVEQGLGALGARAGSLALLTEDGRELELVRAVGYPVERIEPWRRFSVDAPVPIADAVRTGQPVFLENWDAWLVRYPAAAPGDSPADRQEAWAALPLLVEGRAIGGIGLTFPGARTFDDADRDFILTLTRQCAQALERSRLYDAARQARARAEAAQERMAFLAEVSAATAASLDYETTLSDVARLAVPGIADWCAVDVLGEDGALQRLAIAHVDPAREKWGRELQDRYPSDPDAPHGVRNVLRTGRAEFYPDIPDALLAASARDPEHLALLRAVGFASVIIVPLQARGRTLGAVTLVTTSESGRRYDEGDLAFAGEIARRAGLAVDNARLFRQAQEERNGNAIILESITDAFYALDRDWRYTYVNRQCERYYNKPREELLGNVVWDVFPMAAGTAFEEQFRRVMRDRTAAHFEARSPLTGCWLEMHVHPSANGLSVYFRDITERKQAEEERRYVTTHARCLLWHGTIVEFDDGGFRWDTDVSDEAAAQAFFPLERLPEEKYTRAWYRHRLPEGQALTDRLSSEALRAGRRHYSAEFRCRDRDGRVRWFFEQVSLDPRPLRPTGPEGARQVRQWRTVGVCTDITERLQALEAIRESEQRFQGLADAAPVLIWMSDEDALCTYLNKSWLDFTGRTPEQDLGNGWIEGVHPDDLARCQGIYRSAFEDREPFEMEYRLRRHDGEYRWVLDSGRPRFLESGAFAGFIGSCLDITERRRAEQSLMENEARQRAFLRDILKSVTEGKLILCETAEDLPSRLPPAGEPVALDAAALSTVRQATRATAAAQGLDTTRVYDLMTAVHEAAMNAVVHAKGGFATVCAGASGTVQVWVGDGGTGINIDSLPRMTLERGATTAGSLGHGFFLMLQSVDRLYLLTGPEGTTVVLEQERVEPEPAWLAGR